MSILRKKTGMKCDLFFPNIFLIDFEDSNRSRKLIFAYYKISGVVIKITCFMVNFLYFNFM